MSLQPQEGGLFRVNYLRPDAPQSDSARARFRIAEVSMNMTFGERERFANLVRRELGVRYNAGYEHDF